MLAGPKDSSRTFLLLPSVVAWAQHSKMPTDPLEMQQLWAPTSVLQITLRGCENGHLPYQPASPGCVSALLGNSGLANNAMKFSLLKNCFVFSEYLNHSGSDHDPSGTEGMTFVWKCCHVAQSCSAYVNTCSNLLSFFEEICSFSILTWVSTGNHSWLT